MQSSTSRSPRKRHSPLTGKASPGEIFAIVSNILAVNFCPLERWWVFGRGMARRMLLMAAYPGRFRTSVIGENGVGMVSLPTLARYPSKISFQDILVGIMTLARYNVKTF